MEQRNTAGLTQEKETLFYTLYAKAQDARSSHPILGDEAAYRLLTGLDPDLEKFRKFGRNRFTVIRAREYDDWLRAFLRENGHGVVLYLGCGLDTRISRIDPPSSVAWFDLDYPEVISLRKRFFPDRDGYRMIASSITGHSWLAEIPADRPVFILAEGVFEYLEAREVGMLLDRLTAHFTRGGCIAFDVMNSFAIKTGRGELKKTTGAVHKWPVDRLETVDRLNSRLTRKMALSLFDSRYVRLLPLKSRLACRLARLLPLFRNMLRLLLYRF